MTRRMNAVLAAGMFLAAGLGYAQKPKSQKEVDALMGNQSRSPRKNERIRVLELSLDISHGAFAVEGFLEDLLGG